MLRTGNSGGRSGCARHLFVTWPDLLVKRIGGHGPPYHQKGFLMAVIVDLLFMGRMDMTVWTMVAGVIVVMDQDVAMVMPMLVLVVMLVAVGMRVFMGVGCVSVTVFVRMAVGVLVRMQMFVFVVALHCKLLSFGGYRPNCRTASIQESK